MGKTNRTRASKGCKDLQPFNASKDLLHVEPKHKDDDEITASTFPFNELIPNWSTFDPNTKNPATGSKFASGHHGGSGGKKMSDFKTFRLACCLEFIDKTIAGANHRIRCMNVFTVDSNQCTTHGKTAHKDGPNKIYTCMKRNDTATWGMIKDTDNTPLTGSVAQWQQPDYRRKVAAAEVEEVLANSNEADVAYAPVSNKPADKPRTTKRQDSALRRAKATPSHGYADAPVDAAARRRAGLDAKWKDNNPNRRKTGGPSIWRGTKSGSTLE